GVGCHAQVRVKKTYILFDSELIWDYCPVHGMIAKTSSLQPDRSGIYLDMENAPNNMMLLKFGICFNTKVESYTNSEAVYNAEHPAPASCGTSSGGTYHGGGHSGSGGAHSGVHMSSGGHGGGHAK
ncbi:MAG TPA: hypothetical protein VFJ43_01035, partial [Bacteroidia bacterium]|nr:hypothetical protein [Bacteroidia bacterium]